MTKLCWVEDQRLQKRLTSISEQQLPKENVHVLRINGKTVFSSRMEAVQIPSFSSLGGFLFLLVVVWIRRKWH